jgi:hypothetical protein
MYGDGRESSKGRIHTYTDKNCHKNGAKENGAVPTPNKQGRQLEQRIGHDIGHRMLYKETANACV